MSALSPEESPVMLSALQHYLFCPRQCALIHVEGVWSENFLTAAGRQLHERVDRRGGETRKDVHLAIALRLTSQRLGLTGIADMVEFHRQETSQDESGRIVAVRLPGRSEYWRPFPVEYKRGAPKSHRIGDRSRWSTSAARRSRIVPTRYSFAPRPCVWRRCLESRFLQAHCSMARRGGGLTLRLIPNCGLWQKMWRRRFMRSYE